MTPEGLSIRQASKRLRIRRTTLAAMCEKRQVTHFRWLSGWQITIPMAEIERLERARRPRMVPRKGLGAKGASGAN